MTANRIRVGIAVETAIVRQVVGRLLAGEPGLDIVGVVGAPDEALDLARAAGPDVLLLEPRGEAEETGELLSALGKARPSLSVLLLSHGRAAPTETEAVLLGAWGVVRPDAGVEELVKAVRTVASGEHWIGRAQVAAIVEQFQRAKPGRKNGLGLLTERERELATAVASGESNREIAARLRLAEATVKSKLTKVYKKLEVANRAALAMLVAGGTVERRPRRRGKHGRR